MFTACYCISLISYFAFLLSRYYPWTRFDRRKEKKEGMKKKKKRNEQIILNIRKEMKEILNLRIEYFHAKE